MKILSFDDVDKQHLLYRYYRGSHVYGLNTPESDWDEGGIYICDVEDLLGLGLDYKPEIENESHDCVWFELNRFMELIIKSNPTVLESLFIPDKFIIYESSTMTEIKKNRDLFITKQCFLPFGGYAISQINKARGLNKKISWEECDMKRKTPIDFCYTFKSQGSQPIQRWLEEREFKQEWCGLVNIPNMKDIYGLYYSPGNKDNYKGIMSANGNSNELRLSSIPKEAKPIIYLYYNRDGYSCHCRKYKEYCDWKINRNENRYNSNLGHSYDSKNMMHSFRLISMAIEIAKGEGINLNRTNIDREFLMNVRNHKYEYEELMTILEQKKDDMDIAISNSNLPDEINVQKVNDILLNIRQKQINQK